MDAAEPIMRDKDIEIVNINTDVLVLQGGDISVMDGVESKHLGDKYVSTVDNNNIDIPKISWCCNLIWKPLLADNAFLVTSAITIPREVLLYFKLVTVALLYMGEKKRISHISFLNYKY